MSTVLETLITDRTAADLADDTDRAYIAYTDLNRVEEACALLAGRLGVTMLMRRVPVLFCAEN